MIGPVIGPVRDLCPVKSHDRSHTGLNRALWACQVKFYTGPGYRPIWGRSLRSRTGTFCKSMGEKTPPVTLTFTLESRPYRSIIKIKEMGWRLDMFSHLIHIKTPPATLTYDFWPWPSQHSPLTLILVTLTFICVLKFRSIGSRIQRTQADTHQHRDWCYYLFH